MRRRAMLLLVAMGAALVVASGVAFAASVSCDGVGDRDPDGGQCSGTSGADNISGTSNPDKIKALAGNDFVAGYGDDDEIYGGDGNDIVDAFPGNDTVYGGPGGDGSAVSTAFSEKNLEGGEDSDTVYGGGGNDYIDAAQNDIPSASQSSPVDSSYGGKGNDHIYAIDNNVDIIDCGGGKGDVAQIDYEAELDAENITGCEQVITED